VTHSFAVINWTK